MRVYSKFDVQVLERTNIKFMNNTTCTNNLASTLKNNVLKKITILETKK